jgi:glutamate:GABA antiporter
MSRSKALSRPLTIFSLAMINVAAVGTVKNWPLTAEFGFAALFYLVLSAIMFFIPVSLVSAELATGWPKMGGIFVWVKEAFGHRMGFLAIWLLWLENVVWYPTVLSFIAASIAYVFDPNLANNKLYTMSVVLILFWAVTLLNLRGMKTSSFISSASVIAGVFIPAAVIIPLGIGWFFSGEPLQIAFSFKTLIPDLTSADQMVIFIGILLTLSGMEMSAIHAKDVQHPQRDFPRATFLSIILILGLSILGVLSIAIVIPQSQISLVAGSMQAFTYLVNAYHLSWLTPYMAALIAIGAIGSMSTWAVGPSRGLLAAAQDGDLPPALRRVNKQGMPVPLMIAQGVIVSFLSLLFIFMPSVNSAFWIITVMVGQLYLVMYLIMFAAAVKLRYKRPNVERTYRIPGGNWGMWIVCALGSFSAIFALIIGFFPPSQIATGSYGFYFGFLIAGMSIALVTPSLILRFKKPSWNHQLAHEGKK